MDANERLRLLGVEQGSPEWHEGRRGCITASIAGRLLSVTDRGLPGLVDLIRADDGPGRDISHLPAIARGHQLEDQARAQYEMRGGVFACKVGLLVHQVYDLVRCSPDFVVPGHGGGEIKCPTKRDDHLLTVVGGVPAKHLPQIQFSLWVSGMAWWDFVSFRPDEPPSYRFGCVRVTPDAAMFRRFDRKVQSLLPYLDGGLR